MTLAELLIDIKAQRAQFKDVLAFVEQHYTYTASAFQNGAQHNGAHENQGSAKVLYLAQLNKLDAAETLYLFAEHYEAVLANPTGTDHQNIRQFQQHGWDGVSFDTVVLR